MPKHLAHVSRSRPRILAAVAVLAVSSATGAMLLGHAAASTSGTAAAAADTASTQIFACPGRSLDVSRTSQSAVELTCRYGVSPVGRMRADIGRNSTIARTRLPAGAAKGSLLVATVQTTATSAVSMSGWTKAYDTVSSPGGVRLSAWYRVAAAGDRAVTASITPASPVSMITAAFTGARPERPIGFAAASSGLTAPRPSEQADAGQWVSTVGAWGHRAQVDMPTDASGARRLINGDMRMAQVLAASHRGVVPTITWSGRRIQAAVSGLLSVVPGPGAPVPADAIPLTAGATRNVDCGSEPLDYAVISATVVSVTCQNATATTEPSSSATMSSTPAPAPSSPSSTTTAPAPTPSTTSTASSTPTPSPSTERPTAPSATATAPVVGQTCTAPVWRSSTPEAMWSDGGYIVHNNMWNAGRYPVSQTTEACSYRSWNVTATADNSAGDGAVKTYPNVHRDYHDWGTGQEPAWSSFGQLRSTFAATGPAIGIYNIAYDIWMNGVPGNREIMIWTENHNQHPAGSLVAPGVVMSGVTWDVWATNDNGYLAFVARSTQASGSLDLKAMIDWLISQGRVPSNSTLGQVCFGVEIVSTVGNPATFHFTDFSVSSS